MIPRTDGIDHQGFYFNKNFRYSNLKDLHLEIEEILKNYKKKCLKFPDKKWFGNIDP